jgi:hypothetical protein
VEKENKFAELEAKLKKKIRIIIPGYQHDEKITLEQFITTFIKKKYNTIYKKNKKEQCYSGAYRSMGDIYNLCREYYPDVKVEQVMKCLVNMYKKGEVFSFYCPNIRKRVFRPITSSYPIGNLNIHKEFDENGLNSKDYLNLI